MNGRTLICLSVLLLSVALDRPALAEESAAELAARATEAIERGDLRGAVRAMERLRFQGELPDDLRLALAQGYLRLGRVDEAKEEAKLVDSGNGGIELLMLRAELASRGGDWGEARDLYLSVTQRDPSNAAAYLLLGESLQKLGDEEAADIAYGTYVDLTR